MARTASASNCKTSTFSSSRIFSIVIDSCTRAAKDSSVGGIFQSYVPWIVVIYREMAVLLKVPDDLVNVVSV